ncbi:hypothetical protein GS425_17320 [Rhodococcus hoagii]|nr:hypothetical protein [Prescottella equi]
MSADDLFDPEHPDYPGPIFNPDSPFWHHVDFDNLPDTENGLSNELAFVASSIALWLASLGFGITWFPPDPKNVCPLPAWMIAEAYERLDQDRGGRDVDYWHREMELAGHRAYGSAHHDGPLTPGSGLHQFLEEFIRNHEN